MCRMQDRLEHLGTIADGGGTGGGETQRCLRWLRSMMDRSRATCFPVDTCLPVHWSGLTTPGVIFGVGVPERNFCSASQTISCSAGKLKEHVAKEAEDRRDGPRLESAMVSNPKSKWHIVSPVAHDIVPDCGDRTRRGPSCHDR